MARALQFLDTQRLTTERQKDAVKKAACVKETDGYFIGKVRRGVSRSGAVYMPPFEGVLQQEASWAIKSYLETRREKPL